MAWIESHQELGQHPKTKRLARGLGISLPATVGHLHYLWWWALSYAQDGDLARYKPEDVADAAMWDGDPKELVKSLVEAGFLDNHNSLTIHDWDDYAGRLIAKRQANAERARTWRTHKKDEGVTNAYATHNERATNTATVPNRTVPNRTMDHEKPPIIPLKTRKPFRSRKQQDRFDQFWQRYPKKKSKGQAEKAWAKINPDEQLHNAIMQGLERAKTSGDWQKNNGEFILHPATWLNAKGWEDEEGGSDNGTADDVTSEWIALEARRSKSSDFE